MPKNIHKVFSTRVTKKSKMKRKKEGLEFFKSNYSLLKKNFSKILSRIN